MSTYLGALFGTICGFRHLLRSCRQLGSSVHVIIADWRKQPKGIKVMGGVTCHWDTIPERSNVPKDGFARKVRQRSRRLLVLNCIESGNKGTCHQQPTSSSEAPPPKGLIGSQNSTTSWRPSIHTYGRHLHSSHNRGRVTEGAERKEAPMWLQS